MNDTSPPLDGYTIYDPIDPYENHAGPFFWKEENGVQKFALQAEARHCNRHEIVHGGLMMTMIDLAMVVAAKGAGIGLHIVTADLDADGDLEIVVPGKEGTQILWNKGN